MKSYENIKYSDDAHPSTDLNLPKVTRELKVSQLSFLSMYKPVKYIALRASPRQALVDTKHSRSLSEIEHSESLPRPQIARHFKTSP